MATVFIAFLSYYDRLAAWYRLGKYEPHNASREVYRYASLNGFGKFTKKSIIRKPLRNNF